MIIDSIGKYKRIELSDVVDSDGDMEIIFDFNSEQESYWIDKDEAKAIIKHLESKFNIKNGE